MSVSELYEEYLSQNSVSNYIVSRYDDDDDSTHMDSDGGICYDQSSHMDSDDW